MFSFAVLALAVGSQFPSTPVTLSGPAMRLGNLVPLLSERSKFKFKISNELRRDVVLLDVNRMPLDQIAVQLAELSLGRWIDTADGPMLGRDFAKAEAAEKAEFKLRVTSFQKAQAALREKAAAPQKPIDLLDAMKAHAASADANTLQGYERGQALRSQFPMEEAAVKIAAVLPAPDLEAIYRGGRVVFALEPNKLQRQMPREMADVLSQTWQRLLSFGEAMRTMPQEDVQSITQRGYLNYLIGFSQSPPKMDGTWWVTASAMGSSIAFAVEYRGSVGALQSFHTVGAFPSPGQGLPSEDESPLELRPESRTLLDAYTTADPQAQGYVTMYVQGIPLRYIYRTRHPVVPKLEPDLFSQVIAPDRYDPLSYWLSDSLLQGARSQKKAIIAWLGDDLFAASLSFFRSKPTVKQFLGSAGLWRGYVWSDKDGLLTLRPTYPWTAIVERGDRARFASAIQDLAKTGAMRERTLLPWAAGQNRGPERHYEDYAIRLVNPMGFDVNQMYRQWRAMGILGTMTAGDLEKLKRGERLAFSALSPETKARLTHWAFVSGEPLYDMENWKPDVPGSATRFSSVDGTFKFPTGAGAPSYLALTYRTGPAYLARYPGGRLSEPETALQAASRLWVASKPRETNVVALPMPESFTEGEERFFRLNFHLDPAWAMSNEFSTFEITGGTVKGFAALPKTHRDEVERLLKIFQGVGVGSAGGNPPPRL